ncbi:MAG: 2-octaprenyl-6-methoxyphenyl hydroxylase [Steroidobacteraceae bacterium]
MERIDVAIVGGGMVGASFALALAGTRLRIGLIERFGFGSSNQTSFDERTTALGNASRRIYEALGIWERVRPQAAAIRSIHVSDAGRFGFARLEASAQGVEAFGFVAPNRALGAALWDRIAQAPGIVSLVPATVTAIEIGASEVELAVERDGRSESIAARLVVAADGAGSKVREAAGIGARVRDYGQVAVVAHVRADRPHDGTAYERFTPSGPIALLPLADGGYTAVWARSPTDADETRKLDDREFLSQFQERFGWRAGRFVEAGRRGAYPLALSRASVLTGRRAVLIGNAAQALHPVAGQGFNLGLRDAAMLAEVLARSAGDPGAPAVLDRFAKERAADRRGVVGFTDGLVRLFGDSRGAVRLARNLGLLLFDVTPPAKSALARVSTGFGGRTPRLARGLPLT